MARFARFAVATLSSSVFPALVVLVPMGIVFAAPAVFAESVAAPQPCTTAPFVACASATAEVDCSNDGKPGKCREA